MHAEFVAMEEVERYCEKEQKDFYEVFYFKVLKLIF